jgi:hypothetical protein
VKILSLKFSDVKKKLHQDKMHKIFIDGLREMGVTHSQLGHSIHELDYEEAHYEYMLAVFRRVDAETDSQKWF